jgi:hypothetical protein
MMAIVRVFMSGLPRRSQGRPAASGDRNIPAREAANRPRRPGDDGGALPDDSRPRQIACAPANRPRGPGDDRGAQPDDSRPTEIACGSLRGRIAPRQMDPARASRLPTGGPDLPPATARVLSSFAAQLRLPPPPPRRPAGFSAHRRQAMAAATAAAPPARAPGGHGGTGPRTTNGPPEGDPLC